MENLKKENAMSENETQPLTTHEVSRHLKVDLTTVINWCDQGKLKAYRTPGGHRRVQPNDFMHFLEVYHLPVPKEFMPWALGNLRVLVVDDEDPVRRLVAKAFKRYVPEAKVIEAADGFEAGKLIADTLPPLVILDLMLPGVDGFRVCTSIRQDPRFKDTKVLAVTGQSTDENKEKILKAGADDFLPKPFEVDVLMEKAAKLLRLEEFAL